MTKFEKSPEPSTYNIYTLYQLCVTLGVGISSPTAWRAVWRIQVSTSY